MTKKISLFIAMFLAAFQSNAQETQDVLIPNGGFTLESFYRGVIGMISLLLIAYLFSSNRKGINWKTVSIGLGAQLLIAFGVLKVSWVQIAFESVGKVFTNILDYTAAGSEFLFGSLMDVDKFGFIFVFQV